MTVQKQKKGSKEWGGSLNLVRGDDTKGFYCLRFKVQLSAETVPQTFEGSAGSWEGSERLIWAG